MAKGSKRKKPAGGRGAANSAALTRVSAQFGLGSGRDWILGLILALGVFLTYSPVWYAGFIWDDDNHITANPCIIGPLGLKEIWTTSAARFFPLTLTTFWAEHALWGIDPLPYHLVNVFLHAACSILLWQVLRSLSVPGAWFGAALWAVHPVCVESVAWVAEMKNTQSTLFYLLAIFFHIKTLRTETLAGSSWRSRHGALTLIFATLAMASKSSTVILPLVLILCTWWIERRFDSRKAIRIWPVFAMSLVVSVLTVWAVKAEGVVAGPQWNRGWPERLATAGDAFWFYLGKLAWPHPLLTIYPRWQIDTAAWLSYLPLMTVIAGLGLLAWKRQGWARPGFFASAYFIVALLPVLGLVSHNFLVYSFVADHFQYMASMGPLALAGAALTSAASKIFREASWARAAAGAIVLGVLALLSWQRAWDYQNSEILWTRSLAGNPNSAVAHLELGNALLDKGDPGHAQAEYLVALQIDPDDVSAHNNLGYCYLQTGDWDNAIGQYQKAVAGNPRNAEYHCNLGNALAEKGQPDEAIAQYQQALALDPSNARAHCNLGAALYTQGHVAEAIAQFHEALRVNPGFVNAQINLAKAQSGAQPTPPSR